MLKRSLRAAFALISRLFRSGGAKAPTGTLSVAPTVHPDAGHQALVGQPVLVSLLLDGKLIQQREMPVNGCCQWVFLFRDLPLGTYSVRFEGPGVETIVKRNLAVTAAGEPVVIADLKAGPGTRVIEYGKEGPGAVTALLGRVKELEAVVAAMNKAS